MRRVAKNFVVLCSLATVFGFSALRPAQAAQKRDSLKGLIGMAAIVEEVSDTAQRHGVETRLLQTELELTLRRSGIRILSKDEAIQTVGQPALFLTVTVVCFDDASTCAGSVKLNLVQTVALVRAPDIRTFANTWDSLDTFIVGAGRLKETVKEHLGEVVDRLANDYLAANPR